MGVTSDGIVMVLFGILMGKWLVLTNKLALY